MKKLKNIFKSKTIKVSFLLLLTLCFTGCTDNFDYINTDLSKTSPADEKKGGGASTVGPLLLLNSMMHSVYIDTPIWVEQIKSNLSSDAWSGYLIAPTGFRGNINNGTYSLVDGWNAWSLSQALSVTMNNYKDISENKKVSKVTKAITSIVRVSTMAVVTDKFGPIIYSKFGTTKKGTPYDSQQQVYTAFFKELTQAIKDLDNGDAEAELAKNDIIFGGGVPQWKAYANSLRLRLAVRVSKVDPNMAKTEGEKALADAAGFIKSTVEYIPEEHPLNRYTNEWDDARAGASLLSFLSGYKDPRLPKYFNKVDKKDPDLKGFDYLGIRGGAKISGKADYTPYSKMVVNANTPIVWMRPSEIYFLKAEAALRSWAGAGDAKMDYEQGVKQSFIERGAEKADAYLASSATPANYVDPKEPKNSIKAKTVVTPKWDDAGGDKEKQLEKIITQKYLAGFPNGEEAWSEYRRTGYPNIFQIYRNTAVDIIPTQVDVVYGPKKVNGIRRINFSSDQVATNKAQIDKARGILNKESTYGSKADDGSTSVWWDVNKPNL